MSQYSHSTLYTKSACSHTCTLSLQTCQISSNYFFISDTRQLAIHYTLAELLSAYVCDLYTLLLQVFLFSCIRTTSSIFSLSRILIFHKLFVCEILVRIQDDIDISTSYVLNLLCPLPWDTSCFIVFCDCQSLLL